MAKLTHDELKLIERMTRATRVGAASPQPAHALRLLEHIDALTQENTDLRARIAAYEQAEQELREARAVIHHAADLLRKGPQDAPYPALEVANVPPCPPLW